MQRYLLINWKGNGKSEQHTSSVEFDFCVVDNKRSYLIVIGNYQQ